MPSNDPVTTTRDDYPSDEEIERLLEERGFIRMVEGTRDNMPNMPKNIKFDDHRKMAFLSIYSETGQWMQACTAVDMSRYAVNRHRRNDPVFAVACDEAKQYFCGKLETEMYRRAVDGVKEPIIGGRNKDEIVTYVTRYSDNLLVKLSQRHIPEMNPDRNVKVSTNSNVNVNHGGSVELKTAFDFSKLSKEDRGLMRKLLTKEEPEEVPQIEGDYEVLEEVVDGDD